jgi:hypothetical protein
MKKLLLISCVCIAFISCKKEDHKPNGQTNDVTISSQISRFDNGNISPLLDSTKITIYNGTKDSTIIAVKYTDASGNAVFTLEKNRDYYAVFKSMTFKTSSNKIQHYDYSVVFESTHNLNAK